MQRFVYSSFLSSARCFRYFSSTVIPLHLKPFARQVMHESQFTKEAFYYQQKDGKLIKEKKTIFSQDHEQDIIKDQQQYNKFSDLIWRKIIVHLLPKGFPDSVHPNYLTYVKWQTLQYIAGSMSGVLSMQALLYAVGLGSGSIPLAAALNWIIKDGLGQLGGVIFASKVSTNFDANPKKWRFRGELALVVSTLVEIMTPLFPKLFIPMASIANIGKNVSWLAASATRASINLSFTRKDNLADITAKSGSQTIAGCLLGTGLGIIVSPIIGSSFTAIFPSFIGLALVQLYSLFRAVSVVEPRVLNQQRLETILTHYLNTGYILTPHQVAQRETFVIPYRSIININPPLEKFVNNVIELAALREKHNQEMYLVNVRNSRVDIMFLIGASTTDVISGMLYAMKCFTRTSDHNSSKDCILLIKGLSEAGWTIDHDFIEERPNRILFETV
jgi:hypothetical protein